MWRGRPPPVLESARPPGWWARVASTRVSASAWARGGHVSSMGKPARIPVPSAVSLWCHGRGPRTLGGQGAGKGARPAPAGPSRWSSVGLRPFSPPHAFPSLPENTAVPAHPAPRPPASAFLRDSCCNRIGSPAASSFHVVCALRGHLWSVQSMAAGPDAGCLHGKPAFEAGVSSPSIFNPGPVASNYETAPPLEYAPLPAQGTAEGSLGSSRWPEGPGVCWPTHVYKGLGDPGHTWFNLLVTGGEDRARPGLLRQEPEPGTKARHSRLWGDRTGSDGCPELARRLHWRGLSPGLPTKRRGL